MNPKLENSVMAGEAEGPNPPGSTDAPFVPSPKSLPHAASSFAVSMARFAASGFKTVDQPLHELRMTHCQPCEYRHDSQCSLCRCFIEKKAWLPHEDCPIGRWLA